MNITYKGTNILCFFLFSILAFALFIISGPSVPQITHDLAAGINLGICANCDLGNKSNSLISNPVFYLISPIINNIILFYIFEFIAFVTGMWIFFKLLSLSKIYTPNLTIFLIFSLLICLLVIYPYGFIRHSLNIPLDLFNFNFSSRKFFYIFLMCFFYFFLEKKYTSSGVFIFLTIISHATAGIPLILTVFSAVVYFFLFKKNELKGGLIILGFCLISLIPSVFTVLEINSYFSGITSQSNQSYIVDMYNNEIDDFSAIHFLFSYKEYLIIWIIFLLIPSSYLLLAKNEDAKYKFNLIFFLLAPLFIYLSFLVIEIIFFFTGYLESAIIFNINSQMADRGRQLSFIPAVVVYFSMIRSLFKFLIISRFRLINLFSFCFIILISTPSLAELKNKDINSVFSMFSKNYVYIEQGFNGYLESQYLSHFDKNKINEIFAGKCAADFFYKADSSIFQNNENQEKSLEMKKVVISKFLKNQDLQWHLRKNLNYETEEFHNNIKDFFIFTDIVKNAKNYLDINAGIVVPPYIGCWRESLVNYRVWFQEHHDANFMMGSKKIYDAFFPRMEAVNANTKFSKMGGLDNSARRSSWLSLKESEFINISKIDTKFRYIITENSHKLNFEEIYKNQFYKIYKIN